ncbi:5-formyltetrahydrofolate cyclo-ligase [Aquibacillus salsiterrae]|uniref:5-formyltetrahydrofolate cyclo-ligase n=1 Tax=Aquibacillus salsiterrae TaxID=2950439 RepID=A0A9X3WC14_9BACI|nr:5-formyltetrahydrofolate cyclo-ligase [Aquibacillus salsiterrae]MDC3415521.1 5-formyltetrahydrofolate cyclo-ligase [Aquibacillus salsiterrae]
MNKATQREQYRALLRKMDSQSRGQIERKIQTNLIRSSYWEKAQVIGVTISGTYEIDTKPIIELGWSQGKTICVPKCYPKDNMLVFYRLISYEQLEKVYSNLLEPRPIKEMIVKKSDMDLLIVPGMVFDRKGYRIGFGGGYYDRFLKGFSGISLSLAMNEQIVDCIEREPHDLAVDHILTETGLIL